MIAWLRDFMGGRIFPPADWWLGAYNRPDQELWRRHVPAHVGHGAYFTAKWWVPFCLVFGGPLWLAALFGLLDVIQWETTQKEFQPATPLWAQWWDVVLGAVGIGLAWLLLGRA